MIYDQEKNKSSNVGTSAASEFWYLLVSRCRSCPAAIENRFMTNAVFYISDENHNKLPFVYCEKALLLEEILLGTPKMTEIYHSDPV